MVDVSYTHCCQKDETEMNIRVQTVYEMSGIKCEVCFFSQSGGMEERVCEARKSKQAYD